ncbi:MAG: PASTA domain-containing protein [Clostridia bacterium]|nr:PASTA domain-containing protein [Clostridia bacterium]
MKKRNRSSNSRLALSFTIIVSILGLLLVRVGWIQVTKGEQYSKEAALQQTKDLVISSKRGTIYDRNMNELAKSASADTVTVNPREVQKSKKINEVATGLASILGINKDDVYATLSKDSTYEVIKRKINKDQATAIRNGDFPGVSLVEDFKRYYPGGTLGSHIIGFVGTDNQGLAGIEMIYDSYLKGVPGRIITAKNAAGVNMPYKYEKYIDPENGINVVLTIDETIQRKAEEALKKAVENYQVENGAACIIMGAKTGEILAMATYPTFDLNSPFTVIDEEAVKEIEQIDDEEKKTEATNNALYKQWRNKAVVDAYEPGSTFKAMVAAMALEENIVALDENFVCNGSVRVANYDIGCWNTGGHGTESFVNGVYNSCNPVFMAIGKRLGNERFYKYYKSFGFGATTGFDIPGEAKGEFHEWNKFNEVELATASFGQGFTVTPLQLVTAYSAITNDGYMVKPRLVKSLVDDDGNVIRDFEPEVIRQVVSSDTAQTVSKILEGVASDGTSKNAYIEGYHIAGKTGTSEKIPRGNGKYVASFVGFAPADDPEVICLIMLDEPMGASHMGGATAAPTFKEIMNDVLVYLQIESDITYKFKFVPDVLGYSVDDAIAEISEAELKYIVKGDGEKIVSQSPPASTALNDNSVVILYTEKVEEDLVEVPDLFGVLATDANQRLVNSGLNIKIKGSGSITPFVLVGTQQPPAGSMVPRGSIVTVEYNYTSNENVH